MFIHWRLRFFLRKELRSARYDIYFFYQSRSNLD